MVAVVVDNGAVEIQFDTMEEARDYAERSWFRGRTILFLQKEDEDERQGDRQVCESIQEPAEGTESRSFEGLQADVGERERPLEDQLICPVVGQGYREDGQVVGREPDIKKIHKKLRECVTSQHRINIFQLALDEALELAPVQSPWIRWRLPEWTDEEVRVFRDMLFMLGGWKRYKK